MKSIFFDSDFFAEDLIIEQVVIGNLLPMKDELNKSDELTTNSSPDCSPNCSPNCNPNCNPRCSPNCNPCYPYGKCDPQLFGR